MRIWTLFRRNFINRLRYERMKHGELKKALLAILVLSCIGGFYFYWQQPANPGPKFMQTSSGTRRRPDSQWTWQCKDQRCERHKRTDQSTPMSLTTCNMLCGPSQIWPQPTGPIILGSRSVSFFHEQIRFETAAHEPVKSLLKRSYEIFNDNIIGLIKNSEYWMKKGDVRQFLIKVSVTRSEETRLRFGTDESYNLTVRPNDDDLVATVRAKTFFGARHGLETLLQMIWWDENEGILKVLKGASIQDAPAFAYRGLMVDTSRNFMSVRHLKKVLIGMAANKLNVFHWHISDSQSFPLYVPAIPQLAKYGAYGPDYVYTPEDVKDIVDFARVRGIRVHLEVDTPAHAGNGWTWGPEAGLGDLAVCVNERPWSLFCGEPPCGQLNPENPHVYEILEKLYRYLIDLTGEDEIFHLGGDEVNLECWGNYLHKVTGSYNYTDLHMLWGEFTLKALERLKRANMGREMKNVVVWSSNLSKRPYLHRYLNKETVIVQSWGASQWPDTVDLVSEGYRVIVSHVDAWYLDCGFGRWRETGDAACDPYKPWQTAYNHRPWQQYRADRRHLIVGGEVCLWSEQLDQTSLDARLWPRAAAFAERMWSDPQVDPVSLTVHEDVYTRLTTQRERLVARGLKPEAMWPQWCTQNPGMCL